MYKYGDNRLSETIILMLHFQTYLKSEHTIREYDSTLYVGMVQGASNSQYIDIGMKS